MSSSEIGGAMFAGAMFAGAFVMAVRGAYHERTLGGMFGHRWVTRSEEPDEYWMAHISWIICAIGFGALTVWLVLGAL